MHIMSTSNNSISTCRYLSSRPATYRKTEEERQLADKRGGEGRGKEPNLMIARKPGTL